MFEWFIAGFVSCFIVEAALVTLTVIILVAREIRKGNKK